MHCNNIATISIVEVGNYVYVATIVNSHAQSAIVVGTRMPFEVKQLLQNVFVIENIHAVAASYNLSARLLQRIMLHRKYMEYFLSP